MFGDISNLLGTLFGRQLPTQQLTAAYFVLGDVVMAAQWLYYRHIYKHPHFYAPVDTDAADEEESEDASGASGSSHARNPSDTVQTRPDKISDTLGASGQIAAVAAAVLPLASARNLVVPLRICTPPPQSELLAVAASVCAWCCGCLYLASRCPQIAENARRRSVEGLSLTLFALTITGNVLYAASVLLRFPPIDGRFWSVTFPYLLGSAGVLSLDVVIFLQAYAYGSLFHKRNRSNQ